MYEKQSNSSISEVGGVDVPFMNQPFRENTVCCPALQGNNSNNWSSDMSDFRLRSLSMYPGGKAVVEDRISREVVAVEAADINNEVLYNLDHTKRAQIALSIGGELVSSSMITGMDADSLTLKADLGLLWRRGLTSKKVNMQAAATHIMDGAGRVVHTNITAMEGRSIVEYFLPELRCNVLEALHYARKSMNQVILLIDNIVDGVKESWGNVFSPVVGGVKVESYRLLAAV